MTATDPATDKPARRPAWFNHSPIPPGGVVRLLPGFAALGVGKTKGYELIAGGLLPAPIRVGTRARGLLASEVQAINAARAAGRSDAEIRTLVQRLEADRAAALTA